MSGGLLRRFGLRAEQKLKGLLHGQARIRRLRILSRNKALFTSCDVINEMRGDDDIVGEDDLLHSFENRIAGASVQTLSGRFN